MNKLIGFLITKSKKDFNFDFFNVGLSQELTESNGFYIHTWGIGDINKCKSMNTFSLSAPFSLSLNDRNVLLHLSENQIAIENDWLGSIPIFYNEKEMIVSTLPNLCLRDKGISMEGLTNFCEFGYSVFESTIFKDVKFMRYFSKILLSQEQLTIQYKDDREELLERCNRKGDENTALQLIQNYLKDIESSNSGDIIIPTSGGFDSRLLNHFITNKERIQSFTYGISDNQFDSEEVIFAEEISRRLGTNWAPVLLNSFLNNIYEWFDIFGFSTHLHGMYHIEFYSKIFKIKKFESPLLISGIIGDAWSELNKFEKVNSPHNVVLLGYAHGISLDPKNLKGAHKGSLKQSEYFIYHEQLLSNEKTRAICAMRIKILLLSYLLTLPEYFGAPSFTPFLNKEIAFAILNIPDHRRNKRIWQQDFFKKVNLDIESAKLKANAKNNLDYSVAMQSQIPCLDKNTLKNLIHIQKIDKINNSLQTTSKIEIVINKLLQIKLIGGFMRRIGLRNNFLISFYEYSIIKAIELGIKLAPNKPRVSAKK